MVKVQKKSRGDANLMKILLYYTLNIIQNENDVKMLIFYNTIEESFINIIPVIRNIHSIRNHY